MNRFLCDVCGYVYDEQQGAVNDGAPAGSRLEDLPDDWVCPDCGAGKSAFVPLD